MLTYILFYTAQTREWSLTFLKTKKKEKLSFSRKSAWSILRKICVTVSQYFNSHILSYHGPYTISLRVNSKKYQIKSLNAKVSKID